MKQKIIVAGATGNLGGRIVQQLAKNGAEVIALVRTGAGSDKVKKLEQYSASVKAVDTSDINELAAAMRGAHCVVSAVAGLQEVIVDAQYILLQAALAARVERFIPSDFSLNFTKLPGGENRNFDLRRDFRAILDAAPISATSIFNGAFAENLQYNMPFLNRKERTVGYVENPDRPVEFTTMDNTAAFTAAAALDSQTPRDLNIAGFQPTATAMAALAGEVFGTPFKTVSMGTLEQLSAKNKADRAADPAREKELYPKWQTGQYFQSMFTVYSKHLDNDKYPGIAWTGAKEFLESMK